MFDKEYVIVVGNPFDGMHIFGPYDDYYDALDQAEGVGYDWWIVRLEQL
jgi:hypothetical protein